MLKKVMIMLGLLGVSAALWFTDTQLAVNTDLAKWWSAGLTITGLYLIFKVILEGLVAARIGDNKTRYSFRKGVSLGFLAIVTLIILRAWVEDPQTLLVAYGLVAAGVAIALQDLFKNFVGGLTLMINGSYRVGDRIEIDDRYGDVLDIGLMYTTLLELRSWVKGDQSLDGRAERCGARKGGQQLH